ncbi:hypothetical protein UFOVP447_215 [uncultured Caudovirales phage]|uniref:Uncharacterized protein n=1 Tax=uncultured Caudovirales phage TaxID=2100421 RepID=A0A6J5MC34_9CAUD|nr:hypothetical protein UFOVP447_215 [uncultured Caudovirales phage]
MFEVMNRSEESWGPLAKVDQKVFDRLLSKPNARDEVKSFLKKQKKLKTYRVSFKKEWYSEEFQLQAESDWQIGNVAREYFKANQDKIGFKERNRGKWAGDYAGYDSLSYVKVRS